MTSTVSTKRALTAGAIFSAAPTAPEVFRSNFDYQLVRAMCASSYGDGGAVGVLLDGTAGRGRRHRELDRCVDDFEDKADLSNPLTKVFATTFKGRCGMAGQSLAAFCDNLGTYSLAGLEGDNTCPFLNMGGAGERSRMVEAGHESYEKLTSPKAEHIFRSEEGGDAHCQINNPSLEHRSSSTGGTTS